MTESLETFQIEGARWLAANPMAFLGDEMGVGKTPQAIHACDLVAAVRILVVSPKSALYHWATEFPRFSVRSRRVQVIESGKDRVKANPEVVIVTPDLAKRVETKLQLLAQPWDVVIIDEADCLLNPLSKRTRAFYGEGCTRQPGSITGQVPRVWLLSGTPVINHVGELWPHVRALRPELICFNGGQPFSYHAFLERYVISRHTRFGAKPIGNRPDTLAELRARIVAPFILRRLKSQVLPYFPKIRYEIRTVSTDHFPDDLRRLEEQLGPRISTYLAELDAQAEFEEANDIVVDPAEALTRLEGSKDDREQFARLRRLTGLLKVTPAVELLAADLAAHPDEKVIVFAVHLDVIETLKEAARNRGWPFVGVTGATSAKDRQAAIVEFQTNPHVPLFFGQLRACAQAITLTASHEVLFVESAWTPSANAQAAARAHRYGQNNHVRARMLALHDSSDTSVTRTLARKVRMISEVFA